jgi:peroxiredoxin
MDRKWKSWPTPDFLARLIEFASADPRDPKAVDALERVVQVSASVSRTDKQIRPLVNQTLELLMRDHFDDERMGRICCEVSIGMLPEREKFIRDVLDRSTNMNIKGSACLALADYQREKMQMSEIVSKSGDVAIKNIKKANYFDPADIKEFREKTPESLRSEVESLYERVIQEFPKIRYDRGPRDGVPVTLGEVAERRLFSLRKLTIGKEAPEIVGEDTEGKPMKLSDYRGKVVVLTFWATWCGPCMNQVPFERKLMERMKGKPFVLLGVNADPKKDGLEKAMKDAGIEWRSWFDGSPPGPIASRWDIRGFPQTFVIDADGVIRHIHLFQKQLDDAVDELIKEMESKTAAADKRETSADRVKSKN